MRRLATFAALLAACSSTEANTAEPDASAPDDANPGSSAEAGADATAEDASADAGTDADSGTDAGESNGFMRECDPNKNPSECPSSIVEGSYAQTVVCMSAHTGPFTGVDLYGHCTFDCFNKSDPQSGIPDPDKQALCEAVGGRCKPTGGAGAGYCTPVSP